MIAIKHNEPEHAENALVIDVNEGRIYTAFSAYVRAGADARASVIAGAAALCEYARSLGYDHERLVNGESSKSLTVAILGERKPGRKKEGTVAPSRLTSLTASAKDQFVGEMVNPKAFAQFINNSIQIMEMLLAAGGEPNADGTWRVPTSAFIPEGYELANKRQSATLYEDGQPRFIDFGSKTSREKVVDVVRLRKDGTVEGQPWAVTFTLSNLQRVQTHNTAMIKRQETLALTAQNAEQPTTAEEKAELTTPAPTPAPQSVEIPLVAVKASVSFEEAKEKLAKVRKSNTDFGQTIDYVLTIVEAPDADTDELEFLQALRVILNTRFA